MTEQLIREMSAAVGRKDVESFVGGCHPDAVWEHNPGGGSPEEGTYRGHDQIRRHFERVVEGWEYLRLDIDELNETGAGAFEVRGEMHCKHVTSEAELIVPYEQHIETRDRLMVRARMVFGS